MVAEKSLTFVSSRGVDVHADSGKPLSVVTACIHRGELLLDTADYNSLARDACRHLVGHHDHSEAIGLCSEDLDRP
jgi:hypothetical protein